MFGNNNQFYLDFKLLLKRSRRIKDRGK